MPLPTHPASSTISTKTERNNAIYKRYIAGERGVKGEGEMESNTIPQTVVEFVVSQSSVLSNPGVIVILSLSRANRGMIEDEKPYGISL
jgi:hypothetical protein